MRPHRSAQTREGTHQLLQLGQVPLCDDLLAVAVLLRLMDAEQEEEEEGRQEGAAEQAHLGTTQEKFEAEITQTHAEPLSTTSPSVATSVGAGAWPRSSRIIPLWTSNPVPIPILLFLGAPGQQGISQGPVTQAWMWLLATSTFPIQPLSSLPHHFSVSPANLLLRPGSPEPI